MKNNIIKILLSIILTVIIKIINDTFLLNRFVENILFLVPYLIVGFSVIKKSINKIKNKNIFNESFLMTIATVGAMLIGENIEAVAVMIFYQIGELFEDVATKKSKNDIKNLSKIIPNDANLYKDEKIQIVKANSLKIGDIIIVKPFEKIPIDGLIIDGESDINLSMITGETKPIHVKKGDSVGSGTINQSGILKIKSTKEFEESSANKIIKLVESASYKKAKSEKFITSFSKIWTPIVCLSSLFVFLIPNIYFLLNNSITKDTIYTWGYRALSVLVISCPCALIISVPLSLFLNIASCSKFGVLIKGSNLIESFTKIKKIFLDKTGTLTKGVFDVVDVVVVDKNFDKEQILKYAKYAEYYSTHPIAKSIINSVIENVKTEEIKNFRNIENKGVEAEVFSKNVMVGNKSLLIKENIKINDDSEYGTTVYVVVDKNLVGKIIISDVIKKESKNFIKELKKLGVTNITMLTGDVEREAIKVADELEINNYKSQLKPDEKLMIIENEFDKKQKGTICFVGDGINDAACIKRVDLGIAMGIKATDMINDIADVIVLDDNPMKIINAIKNSKKTMRIIYENITFSIIIKFVIFVSSVFFGTNMWLAVFSDVGVMIIAVMNSLRIMNNKNKF